MLYVVVCSSQIQYIGLSGIVKIQTVMITYSGVIKNIIIPMTSGNSNLDFRNYGEHLPYYSSRMSKVEKSSRIRWPGSIKFQNSLKFSSINCSSHLCLKKPSVSVRISSSAIKH